MSNLLEVHNVKKKFCKSLKRAMLYGLIDIGQNVFGYEKDHDRLKQDEFWAVDGISFALEKGKTLGVIGPNGSGKTTLLKMLSGIFMPDQGIIRVNGKLGALIQVGAGFHPLLTGRENVYINGSILGMTKKEIDAKFDSIVDFADIGDFLDTPVKYYSSGMYVRLGFAVAIHCEPDILLVDEILAVGDGEFRRKCFERIEELRSKGVSIVLVSHNLLSVERICNEALFMSKGRVQKYGDVHSVLRAYHQWSIENLNDNTGKRKRDSNILEAKDVKIVKIQYLDNDDKEIKEFVSLSLLKIRVHYKVLKEKVENPIIQISLINWQNVHVAVFATHIEDISLGELSEDGAIDCIIPELNVLFNRYYVTVAIYDTTHNIMYDHWDGSKVINGHFDVKSSIISLKMAEYTPICSFESKWKKLI